MNLQGYRPASQHTGGGTRGYMPSVSGGQAQYKQGKAAGGPKVQRSFQRSAQFRGTSRFAGGVQHKDLQAGGRGAFSQQQTSANDYETGGNNFPLLDQRSRQIKKEPYKKAQRPAFQEPYDPSAQGLQVQETFEVSGVGKTTPNTIQPISQPILTKKSPISFQQAVSMIKQEPAYQPEPVYQPEPAAYYGDEQGYQSQVQQPLTQQGGLASLVGGVGQPLMGDSQQRGRFFYKTKMCPHFPYGRCVRAEQCNFAHSDEELRSMPNLQKTKMCLLFIQGLCQMSDQCTYAHSKSELRATPEFYKTSLCHQYMQGMCRLGNRCRFAHGEEELRPRALPPLANPTQPIGGSYMNQGPYVPYKHPLTIW